ncbi:hypothetical protein BXZ70DRAFT_910994 [Cristinia sonorae]|uniref:Uncharacterized protein n=1 Tax=Cristinia sonorae TaxID=1940300 RepID=A0A8K0XKC2_9AGAR|nr:hypothetical protein BXZ70DRAFT_910994 [Cristinia sonorae]
MVGTFYAAYVALNETARASFIATSSKNKNDAHCEGQKLMIEYKKWPTIRDEVIKIINNLDLDRLHFTILRYKGMKVEHETAIPWKGSADEVVRCMFGDKVIDIAFPAAVVYINNIIQLHFNRAMQRAKRRIEGLETKRRDLLDQRVELQKDQAKVTTSELVAWIKKVKSTLEDFALVGDSTSECAFLEMQEQLEGPQRAMQEDVAELKKLPKALRDLIPLLAADKAVMLTHLQEALAFGVEEAVPLFEEYRAGGGRPVSEICADLGVAVKDGFPIVVGFNEFTWLNRPINGRVEEVHYNTVSKLPPTKDVFQFNMSCAVAETGKAHTMIH